MSNAKTVMSQAANTWAGPTYIEDVFSTYLYTGNGSTQTITNGIDLAGEGGLVWSKVRNNNGDHYLYDTERPYNDPPTVWYEINSNNTNAQAQNTGISSMNSDGFSMRFNNDINASGESYASWTFRKAPRFFDVVTYTGDGTTGRTISHNLGVTPACIIVKCTSVSTNWVVYHKDLTSADYCLILNSTLAQISDATVFGTAPTDTVFSVARTGVSSNTNQSGASYVAYLFAHDPLGPSGDGSDGLIACGSYTGNGSTTGPEIDLGWEPQWVLVKNTTTSGRDWVLLDSMRGFTTDGADGLLRPNLTNAELTTNDYGGPTSTGFKQTSTNTYVNTSGDNYIYIAIRRGPMRQPESGTEVFAIDNSLQTSPQFVSGFPVDMSMIKNTLNGTGYIGSRLTQGSALFPYNTNVEYSNAAFAWDFQDGWITNFYGSSASYVYSHMWRRAPGFFDVVAYTGDGVAGRTVSHNLGVAPEMMIVKNRASGFWIVYHAGVSVDPETDFLILSDDRAVADNNTMFNDTAPTDVQFTVGTSGSVNGVSANYIAYLFATLPGVSKVGSYTGNGSSQTIDCGFTSGARFILIKRTDSTGDWYVWDTARGIVAANDPHLSLNTTAAEVTTDDSVDPDNSGFIVNQVAATNINVNAASYIFYAIA